MPSKSTESFAKFNRATQATSPLLDSGFTPVTDKSLAQINQDNARKFSSDGLGIDYPQTVSWQEDTEKEKTEEVMGRFAQDVTTHTLADVNRSNAAKWGGSEQEPFATENREYGYPESYPVGPEQGLGPDGAKSLAEINRRNAAAYGPANSYESPTNMVGDEEKSRLDKMKDRRGESKDEHKPDDPMMENLQSGEVAKDSMENKVMHHVLNYMGTTRESVKAKAAPEPSNAPKKLEAK